jgi:23S rRNA pseudouridine1911/1915/1917 synthase
MSGSPGENYSAKPSVAARIALTIPPECAGLRLDQALARLLPEFSRSRLARWMREQQVTLDGSAAAPRQKVWGGERVLLAPVFEPGDVAPQPEAIPLDIAFEDDDLLVVNKPAGLVVHPGSGNWRGTLLNALLAHAPRLAQLPRAGIVHRLDKDTSGLLVVAKTLAAHTDLVRQLQARTVRRIYLAVAHGPVTRAGTIEAPVGRHPTRRTHMAVVAHGKPAVTHYEVIEALGPATLLRCRLESGRTHQIRVHLHSIGHPLVGDPTYGARRRSGVLSFPRQALHAERLELAHPATRGIVGWRAELPADMTQLIAALKAAS